MQWTDTQVIVPLTLSIVFLIPFLVVECMIGPRPLTASLPQKVHVLVGPSNYFVLVCNFSVMYFIPLWFQTVPLDSSSTAGMVRLYPGWAGADVDGFCHT